MKKRLMGTALMAVVLFTLAFMTPALAPAVYAHPIAVTVTVTGLIEASFEASSNHKGSRVTAGAGEFTGFNPLDGPFTHQLFCKDETFIFGPGFGYQSFDLKPDNIMTFAHTDRSVGVEGCTEERFSFQVHFDPEGTRTHFNHFACKEITEERGNSMKTKVTNVCHDPDGVNFFEEVFVDVEGL